MAKKGTAKKKAKGAGESRLERWLGTALTGLVLAKVALPHRHDTGDQSQQLLHGPSPVPAGDAVVQGQGTFRSWSSGDQASDGGDHGRNASKASEIPKHGWKDVARRVVQEVKDDGVPLLAGGVTYYAMLALFPALIAVVSLYGLVVSPTQVASQIGSLTHALPSEARALLVTQLTALTTKSNSGLGVSAIIAILAALWSASSGMRWLMTALSRAYDEHEDRKFVKMRGAALLLTFAALAGLIVTMALLVALPSVFRLFGLGSVGRVVITVLRWPLLIGLLVVGLSVLYRYGPNRDAAKWRWVSWGSAIATAVWLVASVGLSIYASTFGKFDKTYGALGAVIGLMLWLFLSSFAVLLGAEINAELEHQTAQDTTVGPERPMGLRQATMADELGEPKPAKGAEEPARAG
jgi:membrane protein